MNRTVNILSLVLLIAYGVNLPAQQAAKGKADGKQQGKGVTRIFLPPVYLGNSEYKGGPIKKNTFDDLLKQGLTSHDSLGNRYRVVGFQFGYAERNVYEDSVGNLQMLMDYAYEYCPGDTITAAIAASIYDRTKPGDTLYFDRVSVVKYLNNSTQPQSETESFAARGMKFVIVK
ncbi:MAG: hypothetical protein ACHQD8_01910 [Chitinophagales bacterium]